MVEGIAGALASMIGARDSGTEERPADRDADVQYRNYAAMTEDEVIARSMLGRG